MRLYVANSTQQVVNFVYRIPEFSGFRAQNIAIGSQIKLPEDLTAEAVDAIVSHHARYGMIRADEINQAREFKGLCYSVDKPVPEVKINSLMEHNTGELVKLGKQIRAEAALTSNVGLETDLAESGRPESLRGFDMSIVEESHDERDPTPAIAEGFRRNYGSEPEIARAQQRPRRRK